MEILRESGIHRRSLCRPRNGFRFVQQVTRGKSEKEKRISFRRTGATPFSALFPLAYSRNEVLRQGWKYVTISR